MGHIADEIKRLHSLLDPEGVELVAVSKFHPVEALRQAYEAGQRIFGESRAQELIEKQQQLPDDIRWHFIGHLQTNKVNRVVGHVELIQSVDSERLLDAIDNASFKASVTARVLLQVHVAAEETKFGFTPDELKDYFYKRKFENLVATHICGLMAMATNTDDIERVRADFRRVASLRREILETTPDLRGFDLLSMGMSGDYNVAIECGSNLVRIGSDIFGERV